MIRANEKYEPLDLSKSFLKQWQRESNNAKPHITIYSIHLIISQYAC